MPELTPDAIKNVLLGTTLLGHGAFSGLQGVNDPGKGETPLGSGARNLGYSLMGAIPGALAGGLMGTGASQALGLGDAKYLKPILELLGGTLGGLGGGETLKAYMNADKTAGVKKEPTVNEEIQQMVQGLAKLATGTEAAAAEAAAPFLSPDKWGPGAGKAMVLGPGAIEAGRSFMNDEGIGRALLRGSGATAGAGASHLALNSIINKLMESGHPNWATGLRMGQIPANMLAGLLGSWALGPSKEASIKLASPEYTAGISDMMTDKLPTLDAQHGLMAAAPAYHAIKGLREGGLYEGLLRGGTSAGAGAGTSALIQHALKNPQAAELLQKYLPEIIGRRGLGTAGGMLASALIPSMMFNNPPYKYKSSMAGASNAYQGMAPTSAPGPLPDAAAGAFGVDKVPRTKKVKKVTSHKDNTNPKKPGDWAKKDKEAMDKTAKETCMRSVMDKIGRFLNRQADSY
jgi:hypothetical protein